MRFGRRLVIDAESDEQIRQLKWHIEWLEAKRSAPLKKPAPADAMTGRSPDARRRRYVKAREAFKERGIEVDDDKLQRICKKYDGIWAKKIGGWCVIQPIFSDWMDRFERNEVEF
jgi:hypothetical protein